MSERLSLAPPALVAYNYTVTVVDAAQHQHHVAGEARVESGDLRHATEVALRESFMKVTDGSAVFGRPGEGGCRGPYTVSRLVITRV